MLKLHPHLPPWFREYGALSNQSVTEEAPSILDNILPPSYVIWLQLPGKSRVWLKRPNGFIPSQVMAPQLSCCAWLCPFQTVLQWGQISWPPVTQGPAATCLSWSGISGGPLWMSLSLPVLCQNHQLPPGLLASRLKLPRSVHIHPTFHISQLYVSPLSVSLFVCLCWWYWHGPPGKFFKASWLWSFLSDSHQTSNLYIPWRYIRSWDCILVHLELLILSTISLFLLFLCWTLSLFVNRNIACHQHSHAFPCL